MSSVAATTARRLPGVSPTGLVRPAIAKGSRRGKMRDSKNLEATLEDGWTRLAAGDVAGARAAAEAAVALDARSADAHTLAGAVAAAEGDRERALAAFRSAMKLDAEAFEPAILAAELLAGEEDLDAALTAAGAALDRADEEDDFLDALLLKAEIEIPLDDRAAPAATLAELPPADVELP